MKKIFSLILTVILLVGTISCAFTSSAAGISLSAGKDALVAQWTKGSDRGIDYRYFSPVENGGESKKYPLVVMLHGKYSGSYEGEQITGTDFYKWSSSEFQTRFSESAGAFLFAPRTPGGDGKTWANAELQNDLMNVLSGFIVANNDYIDRERIYIVGWSMGGAGAVSLASSNSNFFAAAVIIAPFDSVSQAQVNGLKNTPVWLVTCTKDTTASHVTFAKPFWNKVVDTTNIPSYCRITTFSKYNYYDSGHHYVHFAVANDLLNQPSDCGMKTEDARGNRINTSESESIITWLSSQRLGKANESGVCKCNCHSKKGWTSFIWSIKCFFWRLFGNDGKRYCACGNGHW
ncbi:MAG: prolyl oligopeptidase family serine peptidase [Clostridia bacterium]|nr:prolyl oligopeptidase family serine peptidase [Clostridia bacterium]